MKALEILYKLDTEYKYAQLNSDSCVRSQFINEAIKELEELNNRSCENCKYWGYKDDTTTIETCNFGLIDHYYNANSFCCNRYEAKGSK